MMLFFGAVAATIAWAKADHKYRIMQLRLIHSANELSQMRKDIARGNIENPLAQRSEELDDALKRIGKALDGSKKNDTNAINAIRTILSSVAPQYVITAKVSHLEQRRSVEERNEFLQSVKEML